MTVQEIALSYNESFQFLQAWKLRKVRQLVLLNNLQRPEQSIASTLLLTLFNRTLSTAYDDKMQVKFLPSQGINQDQLNAFNMLAQSDYLEMDKARLDYDLCWDTLFFGRGYEETLRFDKKRKIMQPHVINPLMFGYDPYMAEPQEWRYYWKWVTKTKWELQKLINKGVLRNITANEDIKLEQIQAGIDPYLYDYKIRRDKAKKAVEPPISPAGNDVYQILEFYGYDSDGDKAVFWTDKTMAMILMESKLNLKDGEQQIAPNGDVIETGDKWPIVVKECFREPHSSTSYGVADLLEDKHRAKSVLLNLAFLAAKDRANPLYWYNPDKIKDLSQFFNRQISQHIPTDGPDAVGPLNTEDPMSGGLIQFISMLTQEANDPVGTGQVGQPMAAKGDKTATHDAIQQQMNDMATSLQSKVMQFGEKEFWSHWFYRYKRYGADLGEKMANIVGVKGISSQTIDLKDFVTKFPPGVLVYSAKEAEYKEMILRKDLMQIYPQLQMALDHDGFRNFNKHIFFPKFLQDPSMIDVMFPKTLDETKAEDENVQLAANKLPQVSPTDDHTSHIYIHSTLTPKTWALWFHINEHEKLLEQQKKEQARQGITPNMPQGTRTTRVSESIDFKDLPPEGQIQMAAMNGISLQNAPGPTGPPSQGPQGQPGQPGAKPGQPPPMGQKQAVTPNQPVMQNSQTGRTNPPNLINKQNV